MPTAQIRSIVQSDLDDAAFDAIVDMADSEIVAVAGTHDGVRQRILSCRMPRFSVTLPAGSSLTSVRQTRDMIDWKTLSAGTDYHFVGGQILGQFGGYIEINYVEPLRTADRRYCLIELVRLQVRRTGLASENIGGYQYAAASRNAQADILRRVSPFRIGAI